jgi:hypothetical protein
MNRIIAFGGIGSLIGILLAGVSAILSVIWEADFAVRVSFTAMVVSAVVFVAALIATNSPLYRD